MMQMIHWFSTFDLADDVTALVIALFVASAILSIILDVMPDFAGSSPPYPRPTPSPRPGIKESLTKNGGNKPLPSIQRPNVTPGWRAIIPESPEEEVARMSQGDIIEWTVRRGANGGIVGVFSTLKPVDLSKSSFLNPIVVTYSAQNNWKLGGDTCRVDEATKATISGPAYPSFERVGQTPIGEYKFAPSPCYEAAAKLPWGSSKDKSWAKANSYVASYANDSKGNLEEPLARETRALCLGEGGYPILSIRLMAPSISIYRLAAILITGVAMGLVTYLILY